jgi:hypothetical protein
MTAVDLAFPPKEEIRLTVLTVDRCVAVKCIPALRAGRRLVRLSAGPCRIPALPSAARLWYNETIRG